MEALYLSGLAALKLGYYNDCIEFCKKCAGIKPDKTDNYLLIAESYLNLKDKDNCLDSFKKYEQYCSKDWKYYNSWGIAFQNFNMWEESLEKLYKSVELKDNEYVSHNALSYSLLMLERYDEAKNEIDKVLSLCPTFASSHYNLAKILFKEKNYKAAIDSFKKALSLDASLKQVYFDIALCYNYLDDFKNAVKYWLKSADYDKTNPQVYVNLALCYLNQYNDNLKALRYIRTAYEFADHDCDVVFKYGLILLKINEIHRAKEKFEEVIKLNPNLELAYLALAECELKLNKPANALELLDKCSGETCEKRDFLYVKLYALSEIIKNDTENIELKNTIVSVCDKIIKVFGEDETVVEIKKQYSFDNEV